jgi:tetratricopeptide (TPR) repeat protein/tRNA A-37 threonylcarbamoyl transferase component Bud32
MIPADTNEERIIRQARERPAAERAVFLDAACAGDAALRGRLETLLATMAAHDASPELQAMPAASATIRLDIPDAPDEVVGRTVAGTIIAGRYTLIEKIGEGGMGEVWVASQTEPVKRKVALKLIRAGMDSKAVVQRFDQERQALAVMDHPSIARVFDGGMTPTGQPFFAMELVHGLPLNKFCDEAKLTPKRRLELFVVICQAVQHAHQKGIVHRDLKPANILVALIDGKPVPKVIDFGVAKATAGKLTDESMATQFGALIGTLEYMAPEQAAGQDIDTRADIYALGVILYELLTGLRPISVHRLREAALVEILRMVQEEEPMKPSTRLSTEESLPSLAALRQTEPRKLMTMLRGELDWVVMRCLEKQRDRRYATANGLVRDLQRYLADEPVEARPPSAGYRFQKFVHRNKVQVIAASLVLLTLLGGIIGTSLGLVEAKRQGRLAEARRKRAVAAEAETKKRADELAKVSEFQAGMLSQIDATDAGMRLMASIKAKFAAALEKSGVPESERAARTEVLQRELLRVNATDTAAEMIDRTILKPAIKAVEAQFKDQPTVDAKLRETLAELYRALGLYDAALPLDEQALATRRRVLGDEHPDTLLSINNLGMLLEAQGKLPEAEKHYRLAWEKRRRVLGEEHPDTLTSLGNLGNFYRAQARFAEAEPLLRSSVEKCRRVLGEAHRDTLIAINCLGYLFVAQGKLAETEPLWREAYEKGRRALGEDDPDVLVWINNLAGLLEGQGKFQQAEALFQESVEKHRRIRGEEHPATLQAIDALAASLVRQGRFAEAEPLSREALEKFRRVLGSDHPDTLHCMNNLGDLLNRLGRPGEAEAYLRESLAAWQRVLGNDHPDTLIAMNQLASLLMNQDKLSDAETLYRQALEKSRRALGADHPDTLVLIINLGNLLVQARRLDEAEPLIREALAARRRVSGEEHPETLIALSNLGLLLERQEKLTEAEQLDRDALGKFRKVLGNDHPSTLNAIANLAGLLRTEGKPAEADPLYREALAGMERKLGKAHVRTASARMGLGRTLTDLNGFTDAEPELNEAQRVLSSAQGVPAARQKECLEALVKLYSSWDKADPAKGHDAKTAEWKAKLEAAAATSPEKKS